MNTKIIIYDNNTSVTGTYKVWYKDAAGNTQAKVISEEKINSLLNIRQKERFFMGQCKFKIESEFDFRTTFLQ